MQCHLPHMAEIVLSWMRPARHSQVLEMVESRPRLLLADDGQR